jgi:imidazolonepropionase-like amidohydrolase
MADAFPVRILPLCLLIALGAVDRPSGQSGASREPTHARPGQRLLIQNAMIVYGNGNPPFGPADIVVEDGLIARITTRLPGTMPTPTATGAVIDATGKYVLPGFVNTHMHWHEERAGVPQPIQYERHLYLASGVTTAREVGGVFERTRQWRAEAAALTIVSPRILLYPRPYLGSKGTPDEIRAGVMEAKEGGADGLKIGGLDRDQLEALMDEAHRQGLRTTAHIGVEETTARDYIDLGVSSIEHFYGIADAALQGVQDFPPNMNINDEVQRFARAGELYRQANPEKLRKVLDLMIEKRVGWSPTLSIYEATRDVTRARTVPWFREYLHPALEEYWRPNPANHGSFFIGWTNTHEVRWKQNYRIWMDALRYFGTNGGVVTTGDDAGYLYSLYGFGLVRELELHEEAGFHPLEAIRHATVNGARMVGLDSRIGKVRVGYVADLLVVNGNPLENLRLLYPTGADVNVNGVNVRGGGIEWTIKDGIPYHVPTLMQEVRELVARARAERARQTTAAP